MFTQVKPQDQEDLTGMNYAALPASPRKLFDGVALIAECSMTSELNPQKILKVKESNTLRFPLPSLAEQWTAWSRGAFQAVCFAAMISLKALPEKNFSARPIWQAGN